MIFAKTRHVYESYTDFWKLVEVSGYPTVFLDEIDTSIPETFVFTPFNGEVPPILAREKGRGPGRIVWWFLERFDAEKRPLSDLIDEAVARGVDEVWVSDRWVSTMDQRLRFVPVGSHPALRDCDDHLPTHYDFTHQSYAWGRRQSLYAQIRALRLREGPSAWGKERDIILRQSRVMVNAQQYEAPVVAPLRFALAAAYGMVLVSEAVRDAFPLDSETLAQGQIATLPNLVHRLSMSHTSMGVLLHQLLCHELSFRVGIQTFGESP